MARKRKDCLFAGKFDYYPLRGYVYGNKNIKDWTGLANVIGTSKAALSTKLHNGMSFTQNEIMKIKKELNLTNEQIGMFFFTEQKE